MATTVTIYRLCLNGDMENNIIQTSNNEKFIFMLTAFVGAEVDGGDGEESLDGERDDEDTPHHAEVDLGRLWPTNHVVELGQPVDDHTAHGKVHQPLELRVEP